VMPCLQQVRIDLKDAQLKIRQLHLFPDKEAIMACLGNADEEV